MNSFDPKQFTQTMEVAEEVARLYGNRTRIRVCGLCYDRDRLLLVSHRGLGAASFWAPPGGESLTAMRRRVIETLHALASRHVGEQIVLVAHGGVMDVLYRAATGQELQAPRTWLLGNTAINRLLWSPEGLSLVGWSDTSHLDDETLDENTA